MTSAFSVVIPLFNKAPHIEAAVASALEQSLSPREVIVVDDGSTDGGLELVANIADSRLKILSRSPPGPGGYAARNFGIERATSDWIAFLDADDLWHKDHLLGLDEAIRSCGSSVDCAFSGVELVFGDRRKIRRYSRQHTKPRTPLSFEAMLRAWLDVGDCPLWTGAVAFRRSVLIDAGLFPAGRARRGGDKDLWLRAMLLCKCVYSGVCTAEFHQVAVNRVTKLTPHTELPIIASTIRDAIPTAPPHAVPLLRRLANVEIAAYARYSAGRGAPVFVRFAKQLYFPEGLGAFARMCAYYAAGMLIAPARRRNEPDSLANATS